MTETIKGSVSSFSMQFPEWAKRWMETRCWSWFQMHCTTYPVLQHLWRKCNLKREIIDNNFILVIGNEQSYFSAAKSPGDLPCRFLRNDSKVAKQTVFASSVFGRLISFKRAESGCEQENWPGFWNLSTWAQVLPWIFPSYVMPGKCPISLSLTL